MERSLRFGFVAILGLFAVATARADDGALDKLYGEGVHAYFAGNSTAAHRHLDEAIRAGSRDPRAYYFRGLASLRLGFRDAAGDDFRLASTLETQSADAPSVVSQALQRIQGSVRMSIEKHRVDARLAALQAQRTRERTRYGESRTRAREELESRAGAAGTTGTPPAADAVPAAGDQATEKLFGDVKPAEATEEMPAEDATPAEENPAEVATPGEEPMPEELNPTEEPPADATPPEAAPEEEMPAEESPAKEEQATGNKPKMSLDKLGGIIGRSVGRVGGGWGKALEKAAADMAPGIPRAILPGQPASPGIGEPRPADAGPGEEMPIEGDAPEKPDPFEDENAGPTADDGAEPEGPAAADEVAEETAG